MPALISFLVRLLLIAVGLVVAAGVAATAALLLVAWAARAGWSRLTGRPAAPFAFRVHRFRGFGAAAREPQPQSQPAARRPRHLPNAGDIVDVEPRQP
jgi:hypothetical protein